MTYSPTTEDLMHILATDGDRFSAEERRILEDQISHSMDIGSNHTPESGEVMEAWANRWIELGGNEGRPLASSVLPPEPDDEQTFDPDFAAVCVECCSNEPCCFISGTISDRSDTTRKITWPPERVESGPEPHYATRLLVIAREMDGAYLTANVKTEWEGRRCQAGYLDRPRLETTGLVDDRRRIEEQQAEVATGYYQHINTTMALKKYVPENVLHALMAMDAMLAIASTLKGSEGASFTPMQCLADPAMGMACQVIPLPYTKLDGKLELASDIGFTTGGVTASAEARGDLTGRFASYRLSADGTAGGSANTGQAADRDSTAPGLVGMMARIIGTLDHYVAEGNEQRRPLDRTEYASGVRLTKSLTLESEGFELKAKTGSPDLQFSMASLSTVFSIGVSGKLDFIDALAMALGPSAPAIREARARMAAGEHISATLDAYLEMAATGSLTHSVDSGVSITIPAHGGLESANEDIQQEVGGKIEIKARAELAIEVEAEVWIFSARAGASGSLHTSWCWVVEKREGERQRGYEFEGVRLILISHGHIRVRNRDGGVSQTGPSMGSGSEEETQFDNLFKGVDKHINDSEQKAEEIDEQREELPQGGRVYTIWQPTELQWQAY